MLAKKALLIYFIFAKNIAAFSPQKTNSTIKDSLKEIRDAVEIFNKEESSSLKTHQLDSVSFDSYYSRHFLYGYKAIANYLIANNTDSDERKLHLLKSSIQDINHALNNSHIKLDFLEKWKIKIYDKLIKISFKNERHYDCIHYIEQMTLKGLFKKSYLPFMASSLFKSKQHTRLGQLVLENRKYFEQQSDSISGSLKTFTYRHLQTKTSTKKKTKKTKKTIKNSWEQRLSSYIKKSKQYVFKEDNIEFLKLFKKYMKLKKSTNKNQRFVTDFFKNIDKFPPFEFAYAINHLWKKTLLEEAVTWSDVFLSKYWGHPDYPKILYYKSRLLEDQKKYKSSVQSYRKLLELNSEQYQEKANYRLGWVLFLQNDPNYIHTFKNYQKNFPEGTFASTSKLMANFSKEEISTIKDFFTTKSFKKEITNESFIKNTKNYLKKYPLNLYSLLLASQNNKLWKEHTQLLKTPGIKHVQFQKDYPNYPVQIKDQIKIKIYYELVDLNLIEHAKHTLNLIEKDSNYEELLLKNVYRFKELKHLPGLVINSMIAFVRIPKMRKYVDIKNIFPQYKSDLITDIVTQNKSNIPTSTVLSIIRQESAFNRQAISSAKAYGLMQIIKKTAQQVADSKNLKNYDLFKDKDNINLGTTYLAKLLKKFDNNLVYALAAYNAGPKNAKRWIKLRGDLDSLAFIETIPFTETKNYIKLVLRNILMYEILYNDIGSKDVANKLAVSTRNDIKKSTQ